MQADCVRPEALSQGKTLLISNLPGLCEAISHLVYRSGTPSVFTMRSAAIRDACRPQ